MREAALMDVLGVFQSGQPDRRRDHAPGKLAGRRES